MNPFKTDAQAKEEVLFKAKCPALGLNVILFRQAWEQHILPSHPQLGGKEEVVKQVIQSCHLLDDIFQKVDRPKRLAIQKRCSDFEPINSYLRVAIEIKKKGNWAIVTSAYPVNSFPKKGVKKYEPGK